MQGQTILRSPSLRWEMFKKYAKKRKESRQVQRLHSLILFIGRTNETLTSSVSILIQDSKIFVIRKNMSLLDNNHLREEHLGVKKLHLNRRGNSFFAKNLLGFIENKWILESKGDITISLILLLCFNIFVVVNFLLVVDLNERSLSNCCFLCRCIVTYILLVSQTLKKD